MDITIDVLLDYVNSYNPEAVEAVKKAYDLAEELHRGQMRQSGEPYIIHPLHVAYFLAEMHADQDTLCAGILHDAIEDTGITIEEIATLFNETVANLVDGVTKISKMNFSSKTDENSANTRKIITSIITDVRIIVIKLADRVHNMETLQFKSEFKQKENALETMEIFVPLAYYTGNYRIKSILEDLSFKYLKPDIYYDIEATLEKIKKDSDACLNEILMDISEILSKEDIPFEIKVRTKNIYGIYRQLQQNRKLCDIHDLLSLKIMVDDIKSCYYTLMLVHSKYRPMNERFKDYICNPKTNMYQSLHTTVFGPGERLIQTQIRTFEMDKIASFGITAYWDIYKGEARYIMQKDLSSKFQFFKSLTEINEMFSDNSEFVAQIKKELFLPNIYIFTTKGEVIELPVGSTPIDFAYKLGPDIGNTMVEAIVNDEYVPLNYPLRNKDRVRIITNDLSFGPRLDWADKVQTTYAKKMILDFCDRIRDK